MTSHSGPSFLLSNGRVIDPSLSLDGPMDILIEDGKISAIEPRGKIPPHHHGRSLPIVDAQEQWIIPGLVDVHVHFRDPGQEHKENLETGALAAVAGGFTSVAVMANTEPVNDNAQVTAYIQKKSEQAPCRIYVIGAATRGLQGERLAEIGAMAQLGIVAVSDDGHPVMNAKIMRHVMEYAHQFGLPVISHAEDANLSQGSVMNEGEISTALGLRGNPAASEEIMIAREIALARLTGCHVHIAHVSTALGVTLIKRAKEEGVSISAEVTPHHLALTEKEIIGYRTCCKMAPPLRTERDILALRSALASGVIDIIATDHAPHAVHEKDVEFDRAAFGVIGLQTVVPLGLKWIEEGAISLSRWIQCLTSKPAQLIRRPVGTLKVGSPADITLIDPNKKWRFDSTTNVSRSNNSPWFGHELKGKVTRTFFCGKSVYESQ